MADGLRKLADCDFPLVRSWLALPDAPAAIVNRSRDAPEALEMLEFGGFLIEAAQLIAHALPKREAVWWACLCADYTAPADLAEADHAARHAAEEWVRYHTDYLRRHAMDRAEITGFRSPEAWAAAAAFWAEGSLAPLDKPTVTPAPHLTGTAVTAAIRISSVRGDAEKEKARLRLFLRSGRKIASGEPGRSAEETFTTAQAPGADEKAIRTPAASATAPEADQTVTMGMSPFRKPAGSGAADETISVGEQRQSASIGRLGHG